jgi:hypothetical protein
MNSPIPDPMDRFAVEFSDSKISVLVRRAVSVSENDSGFANNPADGGVGITFFGAFPFY